MSLGEYGITQNNEFKIIQILKSIKETIKLIKIYNAFKSTNFLPYAPYIL
ncbi:hypothetical protein [Campylobacter helveticus]|nr:hypothetical protein [Campylobacter helveticus]